MCWGYNLSITEIQCPYPGRPDHGELLSPDGFLFESIVQYKCDVGYFVDGAETLECLSNGGWTDRMPTCESMLLISFF